MGDKDACRRPSQSNGKPTRASRADPCPGSNQRLGPKISNKSGTRNFSDEPNMSDPCARVPKSKDPPATQIDSCNVAEMLEKTGSSNAACPERANPLQCPKNNPPPSGTCSPPPLRMPVYQPPPELVPRRKEIREIPPEVPKILRGGRHITHDCSKTNGLQNDCRVCGPYCDHYRPRDSHPSTSPSYDMQTSASEKPCCTKPTCPGKPGAPMFQIKAPHFPKPLLKGGVYYPGDICGKRDGLQDDCCYKIATGSNNYGATSGSRSGAITGPCALATSRPCPAAPEVVYQVPTSGQCSVPCPEDYDVYDC